MRYMLEVETGAVTYGWDRALGFFAEHIDERGRVLEAYDAISPGYDHARPLRGVLHFLSRISELFDGDDIDECALLLVHTLPEELPDHLRTAGEVICNLRVAADAG